MRKHVLIVAVHYRYLFFYMVQLHKIETTSYKCIIMTINNIIDEDTYYELSYEFPFGINHGAGHDFSDEYICYMCGSRLRGMNCCYECGYVHMMISCNRCDFVYNTADCHMTWYCPNWYNPDDETQALYKYDNMKESRRVMHDEFKKTYKKKVIDALCNIPCSLDEIKKIVSYYM